MPGTVILWFRRDLRLADNEALTAAATSGKQVIPVFIWAPADDDGWEPGMASRWWLHHALAALDRQLGTLGTRLHYFKGPGLQTLPGLVRETAADAVYCSKVYEPAAMRRDSELKLRLQSAGVTMHSHPGMLLLEPGSIATGAGNPYKLFTPYYDSALRILQTVNLDACCDRPAPVSRRSAGRFIAKPHLSGSCTLADLQLLDRANDAGEWRPTGTPGEEAAQLRLRRWLAEGLAGYATTRDNVGMDGTSQLSPYLHFGELSPRQVWCAVQEATRSQADPAAGNSAAAYLRQLLWREFSYYTLYHFPALASQPLRARFAGFPWLEDERLESAWREGRTGYPLIDAAMRQLQLTGCMHNRARMVAASFFTKHLLQPWQAGARWFWDRLLDADLANNSFGWQWVAGCGADAAPYFRVFNPVLQGKKFDDDGAYIRQYVPELARLPAKYIHHPWHAPAAVLVKAGVVLGRDYPEPVVDHEAARRRALRLFTTHRLAQDVL